MRRLRRQSEGTIQSAVEARVSALERRIPSDYPLWASAIPGQNLVVGPTAESVDLGWTFPDTWADPTDIAYDDILFVLNDLFYLPVGYKGAVEVYLVAVIQGGNSLLGNYRTVIDAGDQDQHGKTNLDYTVEVWRAGEFYGYSTYRSFQSWGEHPPAPQDAAPGDRSWWYYSICGGPVNINEEERDRLAIRPFFTLSENLAGNIAVSGLVCAVKLHYPGSGLVGYSL